jgi:DNA-binding SARP family transcriptional activator/tetratricopeptide (TPR) repeat protein
MNMDTLLRLSLLGSPRLFDKQGDPIGLPEKAFVIVAFILLTSPARHVKRATLRHLLWDDYDSAAGAANLRQLLGRIRQKQEEVGFELLTSDRDYVELHTHGFTIDLERFLTALADGDTVDLAELCNSYAGDLLEGLASDAATLSDWLRDKRGLLHDSFVAAIAKRIDPFDESLDPVQVRVAARRLMEVEPENAAAHRALMHLHARNHDPARVQSLYRGLKLRLQEEHGVRPDPVTSELYRVLLPAAAVGSEPQSEAGIGDGSSPVPSAVAPRGGVPKITILPPPRSPAARQFQTLAASLIEDITIGLCRFKAFSVVAPHTASQLNGREKKGVLKTYGIDYVVETDLQHHQAAPVLSVKLLNAASRVIIWAEQYSFSPDFLVENYRQLSGRIIVALVDRVQRAELGFYDPNQDNSAYRLYLHGHRSLRKLDLPSVRRARKAFRDALARAPNFVPAMSGQARTFQLEWLLTARGDKDLLKEAESLANQSIEIDPDDARGYRELGACSLYVGHFDESLNALQQAERLNPQYADLLMDFAETLTHASEPASALTKINRAIELNPLCPDHYWWTAASANFQLHQYEDAITCMQKMRDKSPAYRLLAASWAMLGEREKAAEYVRKTKNIHPDFSVGDWMSIVPIRNAAQRKHYEEGLRKAGFN